MSEGKAFNLDVVMIILLMGVVLAGFWMSGTAMDAQMGVLEQKIDVVQTEAKGARKAIAEIHALLRQAKAASAAPATAPAPAAAPAPTAAKAAAPVAAKK